MMSDPNNNNNSQTNLANNGSPFQRSTTDTNSAINNNDTNVPIISQLNPIVSLLTIPTLTITILILMIDFHHLTAHHVSRTILTPYQLRH